jgi:hypothetical protein
MVEPSTELEKRVADLERQLTALTETVNHLQMGRGAADIAESAVKKPPRRLSAEGGTSEEILSWVDKSYILSRVATTSFIVAVALALRTASDSGSIDLQVGSFIGMLYALGLLMYG